MSGVYLAGDDYIDDFWPRFRQARGVCWKLERQPTFQSPDVPSWVAMNDGDWELAIRITESPMRESVREDFATFPDLERRRVRFVELPLTPYLQWEMNALRARADAGERIGVLNAPEIRHLEIDRPLPELITLGEDVLYQVMYSDQGVYQGARRIDRRSVVTACVAEIADLFAQAEDSR